MGPGGDVRRPTAGKRFLYEEAPGSTDTLELNKALVFVYSWSRGYTRMAFCFRELGMSGNCAVGLQKRMREVTAESLLRDPLVICGPGLTVEVDETAFSKRKYQRGRMYQTQWVYGGHVPRNWGMLPCAGREP
uniref:ISXO2-like transposase domain-containing protein n=1 Tax=Trichuris muris TaxID=70415 RepID=A0A5S6Q3C5_TRIMR